MKHDPRLNDIRSVLLAEWDPIGIGDESTASDEYDVYAWRLLSMLIGGASADEVEAYLLHTEADLTGLAPRRDRVRRVVELLLNGSG